MISTLYRPKGAGHGAPGGKPRRYVQPKDGLREAFREYIRITDESADKGKYWMSETEDQEATLYRIALDMMPDLDGVTHETANMLLSLERYDPTKVHAGMFLSAVYSSISDECLLFDEDIDERLYCIGHGLPRGRKLLLWSDTGYTGGEASGTIINFAEFTDHMGQNMRDGTILNFEKGLGFLGHKASDSVIIDFTEGWAPTLAPYGKSCIVIVDRPTELEAKHTRVFCNREKNTVLLREDLDNVPGMRDYLEGLREMLAPGRDRHDALSEMRGLDIGADIRRMLEGSGHIAPPREGMLRKAWKYLKSWRLRE